MTDSSSIDSDSGVEFPTISDIAVDVKNLLVSISDDSKFSCNSKQKCKTILKHLLEIQDMDSDIEKKLCH